MSFKCFFQLQMSPLELLKYIICLKTNLGSKQLCESYFGAKKALYRLDFGTTSEKDLVFVRSDFLTLFGGLNESLRLFIIQYLLKHSF